MLAIHTGFHFDDLCRVFPVTIVITPSASAEGKKIA
jgi:hypothetical protein